MNYLDNSLADVIPVSYPGYSNGVLYEETAGFISPGGSYNVSETTCVSGRLCHGWHSKLRILR